MFRLNTLITYVCTMLGSFGLWNEVLAEEYDATAATVLEINFDANDAVYDSTRNVIYASIASSAGFPNGNSILTIDPLTLEIIDQTNAGSEPNQLAISLDNSRVYVGIDGSRAFRSFTPETGVFGPLVPLYSWFGDPSVAEDFAVSPGDPTVVVVSIDQVGSSADGDLEVFDDSGSIGVADTTFPDANTIAFSSNNKLMSYNNSSTGYDLTRWDFDGANLFIEDNINGLISGFSVEIEAEGGLIYSTNGAVVDPNTLTLLGTYAASGPVEAFASNGVTFFLDDGMLHVFDNATFLPCNTIDLSPSGINATELFHAGGDRLGYVTSNGAVGVIKGVALQESCFTTSPVPDVKVNGSDVLVSAARGESVDLSLALDAGSQGGELADMTIGVLTANGFVPVFIGQLALFDLTETSMFVGPLPPGFNVWLFGFDMNPDGVQEFTHLDWVPVTVSGGAFRSKAEMVPDYEGIVEDWIKSQKND